jgi:hypothetical protein
VAIYKLEDHFFLTCRLMGSLIEARNGTNEAAGKLSGEGGRKGQIEDTRSVFGGFARVRQPVLYNESYR